MKTANLQIYNKSKLWFNNSCVVSQWWTITPSNIQYGQAHVHVLSIFFYTIRYKREKLFLICLVSLVGCNSQHHPTKVAWWATERKLWADIKSIGCVLHWERGELHTGATSVLEIFHMPGLYRKASSVNRKVCFQKKESNLDTLGGGLNGLPNRPEFSCVNTGYRGWRGWGEERGGTSPPSGIKSKTE